MKTIISRNTHLEAILGKKSVLVLGARGTGKSFYLRNQLRNLHIINLLNSTQFLPLQQNPSLLEEIVQAHPGKIIAIDEIQKIPLLMDEIHRLIEEKSTRFLLTGSSARKLKSPGSNLLAGRAWLANLFPLNYDEIIYCKELKWNLKKMLTYGSLPTVWLSQDPAEELDSYIQTYIDLEIKTEGIVRKIPAFSRFLKTAAIANGELLNYQNISSDSGVPVSTLKEHYQILQDTLIGFNLEPWMESLKRKAISTSKFYFFDLGVLNFLSQQTPESENSTLWGNRFETFILNEVKCANMYQRRKENLSFWRSTSQFEVDLLFGKTAIEIKSTRKAQEQHLKGLRALKEEKSHKEFILVCLDPLERSQDGIHIMHYENFLKRLWSGSF